MSAAIVAASAIDRICAGIADVGYAAVPGFLPATLVAALAADARQRDAAGEFSIAGVGRGSTRIERSAIRRDRILWLDEPAADAVTRRCWEMLAALRSALNQALLLGLFSFEGHYAIYPRGGFYRRHRDRFRDDDTRVLSCVLYLNHDWTASDGGVLRLHLDGGEPFDVLPAGGTLACFLSDRFEHEVLPATRERLALTGWFRRRAMPV